MAAVTVQHAISNTIADMTGTVTVFNSSGGTGTALATNLIRPSDWNSAHNVTLNMSASDIGSFFAAARGLEVTTNTNGVTYQPEDIDHYEPFVLGNTNTTMTAPGIGTWYLNPFQIPMPLDSGRINLFAQCAAGFLMGTPFTTNSTGSVTKYQTLHNRLALYQMGTGTASTRLESKWSGTCDMLFTQEFRLTTGSTTTGSGSITASNYFTAQLPYAWNGSGGVSTSNFTASNTGSTSSTNTIASTRFNSLITSGVAYVSGSRMDVFGFATILPPGAYWMAHMFSSTSSTTGTNYGAGTLMSTQSRLGALNYNLQGFQQLGKSVSQTTTMPMMYEGYFATVSSTPPATIAETDVRFTTGRIYWNYAEDAIT